MIKYFNFNIIEKPSISLLENFNIKDCIITGVSTSFYNRFSLYSIKEKKFAEERINVAFFENFILIKSRVASFEYIYKGRVKEFIDNCLDELYKAGRYTNLASPLYSSQIKIKEYEQKIEKCEYIILAKKEEIKLETTRKESLQNRVKSIKDFFIKTKDIPKIDGRILIEVKDITASDVSHRGEDIYLGDITFSIDFFSKKVYVERGSYKRDAFSRGSYIPHQMSDKSVCLGTFVVEFNECFENFDLDVLQVLLIKYASTYDSSDSAGRSYKQWLDTKTNDSKVSFNGVFYDKKDTIYSIFNGCFIPKKFSCQHPINKEYYLNHQLIYCPSFNVYLTTEEVCYIEDVPYPRALVVKDYYGGNILLSDAVFIESLNSFVHKCIVTYVDGKPITFKDYTKEEIEALHTGSNYFDKNEWQGEYTVKHNESGKICVLRKESDGVYIEIRPFNNNRSNYQREFSTNCSIYFF